MMRLIQLFALVLLCHAAAEAGETTQNAPQLREEMWAIPAAIPMLAYTVRPLGKGPFPLLVMNHGVTLDPKERSYFPVIEFRDAALWFARQGYVVVAPVRPGYGVTAIEVPERGLFGLNFSGVGNCSDANFRNAGLAVASIDKWVIDYMSVKPFIKPDEVIVVGQSGGGWGRSRLPASIRHLCVLLSALRPGAAATSTANPTIIARRTIWSMLRRSSDEQPGYRCYGFIRVTTATSGPNFRSDWPMLFGPPAATPNITSCRISGRTVTS